MGNTILSLFVRTCVIYQLKQAHGQFPANQQTQLLAVDATYSSCIVCITMLIHPSTDIKCAKLQLTFLIMFNC